jgi:hypothetical protein
MFLSHTFFIGSLRGLLSAESKITRLRQELAQEEDESEEENDEESDGDEEIESQLKTLRSEAFALEKKSMVATEFCSSQFCSDDFDGVEEKYVKALNLVCVTYTDKTAHLIRNHLMFALWIVLQLFSIAKEEKWEEQKLFIGGHEHVLSAISPFYRAIQICLPSLIDELTSPSNKLNQIEWHKIVSGEFHLPSPTSDPGEVHISYSLSVCLCLSDRLSFFQKVGIQLSQSRD